jgi:hypothetical protein
LSIVDLLVERRSGSASTMLITSLLLWTPFTLWIKVPYRPPHGQHVERHGRHGGCHGVVGGDLTHGKSEGDRTHANTASSSSLVAWHSPTRTSCHSHAREKEAGRKENTEESASLTLLPSFQALFRGLIEWLQCHSNPHSPLVGCDERTIGDSLTDENQPNFETGTPSC